MRTPAANGVAGAGPAPAARDRLLFRRYRDERDPLDRDELVRRYMPLARYAAARYGASSEPYEDVLQVACVALVRAIDRFDPSRGVAFSSMSRYLGRPPTTRELSERLEVSEGALREGLCAGAAYHAVSLDVPRAEDDSEFTLGDALPYHEPGFELADARASLDPLLARLPRRDREVLRLRFQDDLTQREIGERLGLSQMQVSRILRDAIDDLAASTERATPVNPSPEPRGPAVAPRG